MEDIFSRIKHSGMLAKLLYINIGVFIIVRLADVFLTLFGYDNFTLLAWLQLPATPEMLMRKPWTLFTYMFTHFDVWHILFNMLLLYAFGKIFLIFFNLRQLCGVYLMGGIAGGALFLLAYNFIPALPQNISPPTLMGASASVIAIVFAASFYRKNYEISLMLIGRIKIIYLAVIIFLIVLLSNTSGNAGGHIAHIGGTLTGLAFAGLLNSGKDMTSPINRLIDKIVDMFKRKPKMKVSYKRTETTYDYHARKNAEMAELDAILDKLKHSGYSSLSSEEKKKLFEASKK